MIEPRTITAANAARTVLAAHAAGTLVAQMPGVDRGAYHAAHGDKVYRCAIGQCFTEDEAKQLETSPNYLLAHGLIERGIIKTDQPEVLEQLQLLHDRCCGPTSGHTYEAEFVAFCKELIAS